MAPAVGDQFVLAVAEVSKSDRELVRVTLKRYRARMIIDVRSYYLDKPAGVYYPTARGVAIPVSNYEALKQAILALEPAIQALPEK